MAKKIEVATGNKEDTTEDEIPKRTDFPKVVVTSKGRVSRTLDTIGELYKHAFPDRDVRWVYSPEHRADLSNVITRKMDGYEVVKYNEIPWEVPGGAGKPDEDVRVGDVILMSVPKDVKAELVAERDEAAREQARSVDGKFYAAIEEGNAGVADEHKSTARGKSAIVEKTFDYEIEQRTNTG